MFRFQTRNILYTKSEEKIIDYIYQNLSSIPFMSIDQLSVKMEISVATLSRFVRHAGFKDFKELKASIVERTDYETPADKMTSTLTQSDKAGAVQLLRYQQYCIEKTLELLSETELEKAVEAIAAADTVYIHGKGAAASLAELLHFRLNRLGKRVVILSAGGSELFEGLIHAGVRDLIILFGFQKLPREAGVILDQRHTAGYKTLLINSKVFDSESRRGDINLFVYRGESNEYHSMGAPVALLDALIVMIAHKIGPAALSNLASLYQLKEKYSEEIPR